jgi:hypothetical protein
MVDDNVEVVELTEILFTVQGRREPLGERVHPRITVVEFAAIAAKAGGIEETVEVFVEDAEDPLGGELILVEQLSVDFAPLHIARPNSKIAVTVEYNARDIEREYRSSATIDKITRWAIGPEGFGLEGDPSDYQLKHDGEVLPPETHIGQVDHPHHRVKLDLVFKVKPQGNHGG